MANRRGLQKVSIGVAWELQPDGAKADLDIAAFALNADGKVSSEEDFIFFNKLTGHNGAITLTPDSAVFQAWREEVVIDTAALPADIERVAIAVCSYNGEAPFGRFPAGRVELWDSDAGQLARCDLSAQFPNEFAMIYADLRRDGGRWILTARGETFDDLASVARSVGVKV